ncbi:hypothetical protein D9M68_965650 [compost metagenome]
MDNISFLHGDIQGREPYVKKVIHIIIDHGAGAYGRGGGGSYRIGYAGRVLGVGA